VSDVLSHRQQVEKRMLKTGHNILVIMPCFHIPDDLAELFYYQRTAIDVFGFSSKNVKPLSKTSASYS